MYEKILAAVDAAPGASPDAFVDRTAQFAKMTGGTVHLLHVGRGHVVAYDVTAGSRLGVLDREDDATAGERSVVQVAVDRLAGEGVPVHGELVNATEHDIADVIVRRAKDLDVDIIVLGHPHNRAGTVAEHVIRRHPTCSVLLLP